MNVGTVITMKGNRGRCEVTLEPPINIHSVGIDSFRFGTRCIMFLGHVEELPESLR